MSSRSRRRRRRRDYDYEEDEWSSSDDGGYPYDAYYPYPQGGYTPYMYATSGPVYGGHTNPGAYGAGANPPWGPTSGLVHYPYPGAPNMPEEGGAPQPPGPPGPPGQQGVPGGLPMPGGPHMAGGPPVAGGPPNLGGPLRSPWMQGPQRQGMPGNHGMAGQNPDQRPLWMGPPEICPPDHQRGPPLGPPIGITTGLLVGEPGRREVPTEPRIESWSYPGDQQPIESESLTYVHTGRDGVSDIRQLTLPMPEGGQSRIREAFGGIVSSRRGRLQGNDQS